MTGPEPPDIDRRLREAFDDDPTTAARVTRAALADDRSAGGFSRGPVTAAAPRARRRWPAVAAGAAVVLIASALAFWPARPLPDPHAEPPAPPMLSGSIIDGALIIALPDGSTSISWGAARDDRPPDGSGIVFVEGAIR